MWLQIIFSTFFREPFAHALASMDRATNTMRTEAIEHSDPYWGNTALIQACREHHEDIVRELISKGCKLNIQNYAGWY